MSATIIALADARLPDRRKRLPLIRDVERHRAKIATIKESVPIAKMDEAIFAAIDAHCDAIAAYHAAVNNRDDDDEISRTMVRQDDLTLRLLRCRVVTAPGILALLDHLAAPAFLEEETGETILSRAIELDDVVKEFPRLLAVMLRNSVGIFRT
jgi:hypothetical protein